MTHPLTPREKVDVRGIALAAMTEMRRSGESYEMCARWISERVTAALASGSGDHAELASLMRLTKRLRGIAFDYIGKADRTTCIETEAANALEFLLAENAALRAQSDFYKRDNDVLMKNAWVSRATEAERKLAEAVGLLTGMCVGTSTVKVRAVREWLSKEAERG